MTEEWKEIEGYNDYSVSTLGRVARTKPRFHRSGKRINDTLPRILKNGVSKKGYSKVTLCKNGETKQFWVARLMGLTFLEKPENFKNMFVAHNDGNPKNNNIENIRWATPKENTADKKKHGTYIFGDKVHTAKINKEIAYKIREDAKCLKQYGRNVYLAKKYGVSISIIKSVLYGHRWL